MMEIHTFMLGSFQVSAYVVTADSEAMLIDAPEGSEAIIAFCKDKGLVPRMLVNTHGHADHIFANAALKAAWPDLEIAIGAGDAPMLRSPLRNLSALVGSWIKSPKPDQLLADGDRIALGPAVFEVLATPGHTRGGISLFTREGPGSAWAKPGSAEAKPGGRPAVFTGDALFAGGIGRTDFPGANTQQLLDNIDAALLSLPPQTAVLPGHGPDTTISTEKRGNPFLRH